MKKKLNESQLIELGEKREWCIVITGFIYKNPGETIMKEMQIQVIEDLFENRNSKGMQSVLNDLNESTKDLLPKDYVELNILLQEKFGRDLYLINSKISIQLKKIIKKGNIANDEEYRIIEAQVDELCQMNASSQEIEILNNLLISFHNSKMSN